MIRRSECAKFARRSPPNVSQNLHILAVAYMFFDVMFLYALGFLLRLRPTVQAVHFRAQTDEFSGCHRAGFALKFSKNAVVRSGIQRMVRLEVARIKQLRVLGHVLIQIFGLNLATQRICVSEQERTPVLVFVLEISVIEFIHNEFGYLNNGETDCNVFIQFDLGPCLSLIHI